ncbi:DUF4234 domain-containing protein [Ilumatobacter sp.]|uniref:DUF4234 domain-containing protein n=1 Tax=Ilumatobacter sp. TaxID=1967498 RepID=UPI003C3E1EB9
MSNLDQPADSPGDVPPPPPTAAAAPIALGPPGKARSDWLVILVSILTLGIWTWVWSYQNGNELHEHNRNGIGGVGYLLLTIFISPVTMFLMAGEIEKMYVADRRKPPVTTMTGLWFLLPVVGYFIWYIRVQNALNEHWEGLGANAASGL